MKKDENKMTGFLTSELGVTDPDTSLFHVIPAPYERTTSYGKGTANAPLAILKASQQLEVYDGISIPSEKGIFTHAPFPCSKDAETVLSEISASIARIIQCGKIPVLIGGEHAVSVASFFALLEQKEPVGIVQFDAHADLRDTYENSKLSHACVMKRACDMGFPIFQIGVRSLSPMEVLFRKEHQIAFMDADRWIHSPEMSELSLPDQFPQKIYITIDIDCLDPSLMPSTGTPEPGGLSWYQLMGGLERITRGREVVGFDLVEYAPIEGFHAPDFVAARLIYNTMGIISRNGK